MVSKMPQMGVDQKHGPFWGPYHSEIPYSLGDQRGAQNFDQPPNSKSHKTRPRL